MEKSIDLHIPDEVIRMPTINENDFIIYAAIRHFDFLQQKYKHMKTTTRQLKTLTGLKDNRTIKKSIQSLKDNNLINCKYDEMPRSGELDIHINNKTVKQTPFTRLPIDIFNWSSVIGAIGFRLLFYLESFRNANQQYSYPSQERMANDLGLSSQTIITYIQMLEDNKLLTVKRQKGFVERGYVDDKLAYTRLNNQYIVNQIPMSKLCKIPL